MPLIVYNAAVLRGNWSGVEWAVWNNAVRLSNSLPPEDFICLLPKGLSSEKFQGLSLAKAQGPSLERSTKFQGLSLNIIRVRGISSRLLRILYEIFGIRRTLRRIENATGRKDLLLVSPAYVAPPRLKIPNVLYLYDLHVYTHPQFCTLFNRLHYRLRIPGSIKNATEIRVPSQHIFDVLVSLFPEARGKTIVEPPALGEVFSRPVPEKARQAVREKYHLPQKFLLFVGEQTGRKNLESAVKGWQLALEQSGRNATDLGFVMVGERRRRTDRPDGVACTGYVPENELPAFYSLAEALLYPSYDEGYGLPIAEAATCGCKVITSAKTAREITDTAYICDTDAESIANAIHTVLG